MSYSQPVDPGTQEKRRVSGVKPRMQFQLREWNAGTSWSRTAIRARSHSVLVTVRTVPLADFANTTFPLARPVVPNFTALLILWLEILIRSAAGAFDYSWQTSWNSPNGCIVMMTDQPACMSRRCVTKHVVQFDVSLHIGCQKSITLLTRSLRMDDKSPRQPHRSLFRRRDHCQACLDAPLETRRFCLGRSRIASTRELAGNASDDFRRCNRPWVPKKPWNHVGVSRKSAMSIAPPLTRRSTEVCTWLVLSKTPEPRLIWRPCHR